MFIAALFIMAKLWKQSMYLSVSEWIICGSSRQQNIIQYLKEMCYQTMKRDEGPK
jgi:hypothetical protein